MTVGQFLLRLACDSEWLSRYTDDPYELMREAELDERQIELLRVADIRELRIKIEAELRVDDEKLTIITICIPTICDPLPPPPPKN